MSTMRAVQAQAPMMFVATSGISIAVRPMRRRVLRGGPSLAHSSGGRTTLLVRRKHVEIAACAHVLHFAVGSVLAYVFYWIAVIAVLIFMKYKEVR